MKIAAFLLFLLALNSWAYGQEVSIFCDGGSAPTEYLDDNGELTGFSVDVVRELQKRVGHTGDIELVPWIRAYREALYRPNIVLFTASRNAEREEKFHWITQLTRREPTFFSTADRSLSIASLDDAKTLSGIGVVRGGNRERYLQQLDFNNLDSAATEGQNLKKLLSGRIDLVFMSPVELAANAREEGMSPKDFKAVLPVYSNDSYIIMSKNGTSAETIEKWKSAARAIKEDGTFANIAQKWIRKIASDYDLETEVRDNALFFGTSNPEP